MSYCPYCPNIYTVIKGGFICSLGSGRAVVVDTIINKDSDEDVKLKGRDHLDMSLAC